MNFKYISTNVPGPGCNLIDFQTELPGCECRNEDKCQSSDDCVCLRNESNYDSSTGFLISSILERCSSSEKRDRPIFECGSSCLCGSTCRNRNAQFGIQVPLDVFDAGNKGYGLRTLTSLRRGQFVCEYAGEIIDIDEAADRFRSLPDGHPNYIFVLREHSTASDSSTVITTCIDPTRFGNLGRFVNHSCNPNLSVIPIRYDNIVPHLELFANRDIESGEELCYDYAGGDLDFDQDNRFMGTLSSKPCRCGATNCRGYLPLDKELFDSCSSSVPNSQETNP